MQFNFNYGWTWSSFFELSYEEIVTYITNYLTFNIFILWEVDNDLYDNVGMQTWFSLI